MNIWLWHIHVNTQAFLPPPRQSLCPFLRPNEFNLGRVLLYFKFYHTSFIRNNWIIQWKKCNVYLSHSLSEYLPPIFNTYGLNILIIFFVYISWLTLSMTTLFIPLAPVNGRLIPSFHSCHYSAFWASRDIEKWLSWSGYKFVIFSFFLIKLHITLLLSLSRYLLQSNLDLILNSLYYSSSPS